MSDLKEKVRSIVTAITNPATEQAALQEAYVMFESIVQDTSSTLIDALFDMLNETLRSGQEPTIFAVAMVVNQAISRVFMRSPQALVSVSERYLRCIARVGDSRVSKQLIQGYVNIGKKTNLSNLSGIGTLFNQELSSVLLSTDILLALTSTLIEVFRQKNELCMHFVYSFRVVFQKLAKQAERIVPEFLHQLALPDLPVAECLMNLKLVRNLFVLYSLDQRNGHLQVALSRYQDYILDSNLTRIPAEHQHLVIDFRMEGIALFLNTIYNAIQPPIISLLYDSISTRPEEFLARNIPMDKYVTFVCTCMRVIGIRVEEMQDEISSRIGWEALMQAIMRHMTFKYEDPDALLAEFESGVGITDRLKTMQADDDSPYGRLFEAAMDCATRVADRWDLSKGNLNAFVWKTLRERMDAPADWRDQLDMIFFANCFAAPVVANPDLFTSFVANTILPVISSSPHPLAVCHAIDFLRHVYVGYEFNIASIDSALFTALEARLQSPSEAVFASTCVFLREVFNYDYFDSNKIDQLLANGWNLLRMISVVLERGNKAGYDMLYAALSSSYRTMLDSFWADLFTSTMTAVTRIVELMESDASLDKAGLELSTSAVDKVAAILQCMGLAIKSLGADVAVSSTPLFQSLGSTFLRVFNTPSLFDLRAVMLDMMTLVLARANELPASFEPMLGIILHPTCWESNELCFAHLRFFYTLLLKPGALLVLDKPFANSGLSLMYFLQIGIERMFTRGSLALRASMDIVFLMIGKSMCLDFMERLFLNVVGNWKSGATNERMMACSFCCRLVAYLDMDKVVEIFHKNGDPLRDTFACMLSDFRGLSNMFSKLKDMSVKFACLNMLLYDPTIESIDNTFRMANQIRCEENAFLESLFDTSMRLTNLSELLQLPILPQHRPPPRFKELCVSVGLVEDSEDLSNYLA